jgi:hypothetical protein
MKNYFIFLTVIVLCFGCQKREASAVQENAETLSPITVAASADVDVRKIQPVQVEAKTIQETIENYAYPSTVEYDVGLFIFQIEGNFTGSGNREIIAFYTYNNRSPEYGDHDAIIAALCFVSDSSGEKIENVYYINYGSLAFDERDDEETGLVESTNLGMAITYKDRIIGRVADFNGNGKEELYLYAMSGMNSYPYFIEFYGTEFDEIIEIGTPDSAPIVSVNPEEKVITLSLRGYGSQVVDLIEEINAYIWNDAVRQYELLTSETKKYMWNRNIREYEEIE